MALRDHLAKLPFRPFGTPAPVVAVLRLEGVIGRAGSLRRGLNLAAMAEHIERAFSLRHLKAVALSVNSPGGSPVQSTLIHKRIRALAAEKEVPVIAFAEDVAASGGYWLACAGDEIFADESSLVGSIGVVYAAFGFPEMLQRIGVERRVHTAGRRKASLDPFRPEDPKDVKHLTAMQKDIHESFQSLVRTARGERLKGKETELFSGEVWTGKQALDLGLVDGIGDLRAVMRERYGEDVKLRPVGPDKKALFRRFGLRAPQPVDWAAEVMGAVEERLMWNRFGL